MLRSRCLLRALPPARRYSTNLGRDLQKFSILDVRARHDAGTPFTMVTAYDYASASLADEAGIDTILVGDSLAQVMLGQKSTVAVTMEEVLHHCRAVSRGAKRPFLVGDMPFGSYESSTTLAVQNASRFLKEGGMEAVKLEGGVWVADKAQAIVRSGIPVVGHVGLTPQTASALGGYRVQGRTASAAKAVLEDALALEAAGCFAIVLEALPQRVANFIISKLNVPTIGIGAGPMTSGQVLVWHDMLGMFDAPVPKFCKKYLNSRPLIVEALRGYTAEVKARTFPSTEHCYKIKSTELRQLIGSAASGPEIDAAAAQAGKKPSFEPIDGDTQTIAVVGGGALGTLLAARLASSQNNRVMVVSSWAEQVKKISEVGVTLLHSDGMEEGVDNIHAVTPKALPTASLPFKQADVVVVAVKHRQTAATAKLVGQLLKPGGTLVSVQNGLGHIPVIAGANPGVTIVQGVMEGGATLGVKPGTVHQHGQGPLTLGVVHTSNPAGETELLERLTKMFRDSDLACSAVSRRDLEGMVWGKLLVNACINPLTAIMRLPNGVLETDVGGRALMEKVLAEALAVVRAKGVTLPYADPLAHILGVARITARNTSSMLADIARKVPTEVQAINGAIVREGERLNIATPVNALMCEMVETISRNARVVVDVPAGSQNQPEDNP